MQKLRVINLGIATFYEALVQQDAKATQIVWQAPVQLSDEMNDLLDMLL